MGDISESQARAIFYKFIDTQDCGDEPTESFDEAMPKEVPKEDDSGKYLLYHQAVNGIAYLGLFDSPCELSEGDLRSMREMWPMMASHNSRCYLPDFTKVVMAKSAGTLNELEPNKPASPSSSSGYVTPVKTEEPAQAPKSQHEIASLPVSREPEPEYEFEPLRMDTPATTARATPTLSQRDPKEPYVTPLPPVQTDDVQRSPSAGRLPERLEKMLRDRQLEKDGYKPRSEPREPSRSEPRMPFRSEPRMPSRSEPRMPLRSEPKVPERSEPRAELRHEPVREMNRPAMFDEWERPMSHTESVPRNPADSNSSPRGIPPSPLSPVSPGTSLRHPPVATPLSPKGQASIYNDHNNGQVEISWNKAPPAPAREATSVPSPAVSRNPGDSEQILLTRIIEMREELGRLKRDRAAWERARREQGYKVTAHEEFGGQTTGDSGAATYSWNAGGDNLNASQDVVPQYEYDEHLRRRWPSRDQQLVMELEYLHANVMKERDLKTQRDNSDLCLDDSISAAPSTAKYDPLQGKTRDQLHKAGWDQYQPPEDREMVVPVTLVVDLGERTTYRQLRTSGRTQTQLFKETARKEIAQAFKHPDHLVQLKKVDTVDEHVIALEIVLLASGMKVSHVHADAVETLDRFGIRRLKEGSRAFHTATGVTTPCDIIFRRSFVGEPIANGDDEGMSNEVLMLMDTPYAQFEPSRFVPALSRFLNVDNLCIELVNVTNVGGATSVHTRLSGTENNRRVARELVKEAKDKHSNIHMSVGAVRDAEVVAEDELESVSAKSTRSSSKRRRRSSSVKSEDNGPPSDSRRRRRSSSVKSSGSSDSSKKSRRRRSDSVRSKSGRRRSSSVKSSGDSSADERRSRRRSRSRRSSSRGPASSQSVKQPVPASLPAPGYPGFTSQSQKMPMDPLSPVSEGSRRRRSSSVKDSPDDGSRRRRRSRSRSQSQSSPARQPSVKSAAPLSPVSQGFGDAQETSTRKSRSRSRSRTRRSSSPDGSRRRRRRSRSKSSVASPTTELNSPTAVAPGSHRQPTSFNYQKEATAPGAPVAPPVKIAAGPGGSQRSPLYVPSSPKASSPTVGSPKTLTSSQRAPSTGLAKAPPGPRSG
eukprot:TRINITY_DN11231_c0_g2_i1.p1 TRINITY_DN11231_c0_g2~~TRINITY_DN11231_c0_g2_i1.p1  ORF type:complete len:1101 (+),score=191.20 TRINITY_DN11231_c0_g2_i1:91-3393(+)